METQQVIIYNSKWQAETDRILSENPEYVLYLFAAGVLLVGILTLGQKIWWKIRSKRFNKHR
jgi:hypothetical protein